MSADRSRSTLLPGSLDLLVLQTLTGGPHHGYAIARHLRDVSQAFLEVEEGSLYPALHRLERRGWVSTEWGESSSKRRAKYYRLTPKGRKQLAAETSAWQQMREAIDRVLNHRSAEASS